MTILQSTSASAVEAAIKARLAIDPQARSTVNELEGKLVLLNVENNPVYVLFRDGEASVATYTENEPDLSITGSVVDVGKTLLTDLESHTEIDGDSALLEHLRKIFKPSFDAGSLADKVQSKAELGVAAARSTIEGLASEFTVNRKDNAQIEELTIQLRELQKAVNQLEDRIRALENP